MNRFKLLHKLFQVTLSLLIVAPVMAQSVNPDAEEIRAGFESVVPTCLEDRGIVGEEFFGAATIAGTWSGEQHHFDFACNHFKTYQMELELFQNGDNITGTKTFIDSQGEKHSVAVSGTVSNGTVNIEATEDFNTQLIETWNFRTITGKLLENDGKLVVDGLQGKYSYVVFKQTHKSEIIDGAVTELSVNTFPNPFTATATVSYALPTESEVSVELFDIKGNLVSVISETNTLSAGSHTTEINADAMGLADGTYMVSVRVNGETHAQPLVKLAQ